MGKKLEKKMSVPEIQTSQAVSGSEEDVMLQQSMAALRQQEEMEQEAYATGDMNALYSTDSYQLTEGDLQRPSADDTLPDVDPEVSKQQEEQTGVNPYTNVFASMFHKLSAVFGEDSAIGSKLQEIADNLQGTYGQDAEQVQQDAMQERMVRGQEDTESDVTDESDEYIPDAATQARWKQQGDASNQHMVENAEELVKNDEFVKLADAKDGDFDRMVSGMTVMHQHLGEEAMVRLSAMDSDAKDKAEVSNNYMTMMRGLQAYNDTALSGIEEKYADDPEKLEQAKLGLNNLMGRAAGKAYGIVAGDNQSFRFLSERDIQELDDMQLSGVGTYSEYVAENHLQLNPEDTSLYTNGLDDGKTESEVDVADSESEQQANFSLKRAGMPVPPVIDSRMSKSASKQTPKVLHEDRGKAAEERFHKVLENEKASQQGIAFDGLE